MFDLLEKVVNLSEASNVDQVVAIASKSDELLCRFANNSLTVVKQVSETELSVCMSKGRKRLVSSTTDLYRVDSFVKELSDAISSLPESDFENIPKLDVDYKPNERRVDKKLLDSKEKAPEFVEQAINSAIKAGAKRCAGTLSISLSTTYLLTNTGISGNDSVAKILLNIRAFSDKDATGHAVSCSPTISGFNPERAGTKAGEDSKIMLNSKSVEEGKYDVILSPIVHGNLLNTIGLASSAYAVESGLSYFRNKINQKVASEKYSVYDHGFVEGCLGGRDFDDEGTKTRTNEIIVNGVLRSYLHNLSTAKRFGSISTGNAGIIFPHPWNLEVKQGDLNYDEILKESKKCILVGSNWYTRFNNYQRGDFSTVPRDGCFFVENGEIKHGVKGIRISDNMLHLISSIVELSREREWIKWWEVEVPSLCPWILVKDVGISKAY